jgi:hypothetical protein
MVNKTQYQKLHTQNLDKNEADRKWRLFEEEQANFQMQTSGISSPGGGNLTPPVPGQPGSALTILEYATDQGATVSWGDDAGTTFTLDPTLPNFSYTLDTSYIPQGQLGTAPAALIGVTIGNTVVSLGDYAFEACALLSSLTFEPISTLTSIGNYAFLNCFALSSVAIPNSVTIIGDGAFANNSQLTSVTFDPISALTDINYIAFSNTPLLTSITIPNSVTSIGSQAFITSGLTTVAISSATATGLGISSPSASQSFFGVTVQTVLPV